MISKVGGIDVDDVTDIGSVLAFAEPGRHPLLEQLMTISRAAVLEEMASGIAHELNQPLGAIVTFAQAGERIVKRPDATPESIGEVFRLISKEALAAAEGIRRMRRLFDRASLERTASSMADVLSEIAPMLELLGLQTNVRLQLDVQDDLCPVSIDRLRIQHVLFTLVQNAFEAARASEAPAVFVAASGDRYGVEIAVIDSGPGIAPEHRSQLFHPFFTTKPAGTGLGLTSARAIVEAHQGTIGFDRTERGTRFWFRLPASTDTDIPNEAHP